jgi:dienelactone hydrolase
MMRLVFILLFLLIPWTVSHAKIQTKPIEYAHGDLNLKGLLAWDDSIKGKRPGVLVVHEWWGLNDYARQRAEQLASLGYAAFALDMYGKGKVTTHSDQASAWMKETTANVKQWQARAIEGLKILQAQELVDPTRIAAIGYCFGGGTVTQLAYSGVSIRGVVSFHGPLPLPDPNQVSGIKAKILLAHGNADPFLTEDHIRTFRTTLDKAGLDWQMIVYAGARHSFTNPGADQYGMDALKYNKEADRRSWRHMQVFFDELFAPGK